MVRRPPRSTRTDTLLPYTTLCRSALVLALLDRTAELRERQHRHIEILGQRLEPAADLGDFLHAIVAAAAPRAREQLEIIDHHQPDHVIVPPLEPPQRSEERRGGKECVRTSRYRWSPQSKKKKKKKTQT